MGDRTCTLEQHASMSAGDMVFHTSLHSKRAIRTAGACTNNTNVTGLGTNTMKKNSCSNAPLAQHPHSRVHS